MPIQQHVLNWLYSALTSEYHNVNRTYNDVAQALSQYPSLSPRTDVHTFPDGSSALLLHLSGTIPVLFRGTTYRFPISVWLPHAYPRLAPLAYVTPTETMMVRPGQHVDPQGQVYHPYLVGWSTFWDKSTLLDFLAILRDVFAKEPPVISRQHVQPPPPPQQPTPEPPPLPPLPPDLVPPPASDAESRSASEPQQPPRPPPKPEPIQRNHQSVSPVTPGPLRYDSAPPLPSQESQPQPQFRPQPLSQPQPRVQHPPVPFSVPQPIGQPPPPPPHPPPLGTPVYGGFQQDLRAQQPILRPADSRLSTAVYQSPPLGSPNLAPASMPGWQRQHQPHQQPQHPNVAMPRPAQQLPAATGNPGPGLQPRAKAPPPPDLLVDDQDLRLAIASPSSVPAPPIPPNPEKDALLRQLAQTLHTMRQQARAQNESSLAGLQAQRTAMLSARSTLQADLSALAQVSALLTSNSAILQDSLRRADAVIDSSRNHPAPDIDELLVAPTVVANQLYDLVAEERALADAIFMLGRAVEKGRIAPGTFARMTRSLAREWYLKKALVKKVARGMGLTAS